MKVKSENIHAFPRGVAEVVNLSGAIETVAATRSLSVPSINHWWATLRLRDESEQMKFTRAELVSEVKKKTEKAVLDITESAAEKMKLIPSLVEDDSATNFSKNYLAVQSFLNDADRVVVVFNTLKTRSALQVLEIARCLTGEGITPDGPQAVMIREGASFFLSYVKNGDILYSLFGEMADSLPEIRRKLDKVLYPDDAMPICPICFDDVDLLNNPEAHVSLPCRCWAQIHIECMVGVEDSTRCPVCRQEFSVFFFRVFGARWSLGMRKWLFCHKKIAVSALATT